MRSSRRQTRRFNPRVKHSNHADEGRQIFESRFRQFFSTLPDYCYVVSPRGKILNINPAACRALGYSKGHLVGKPLAVIYAPESRSRLRAKSAPHRIGAPTRRHGATIRRRDHLYC